MGRKKKLAMVLYENEGGSLGEVSLLTEGKPHPARERQRKDERKGILRE